MKYKFLFFNMLLAMSLILSACNPSQATLQALPSQTLPALSTTKLSPTQIALLATATSTPTPVPLALVGTPFSLPSEVISPENVSRVVQLARWGNGTINTIDLSPDGTTLAAATTLGIYLYKAGTLKQQRFLLTDVAIECLAISPDGQMLASGSIDGVLLWDLATGRVRSKMSGNGHDSVNVVAFSPDGTLLASGTDYATIDFWNPTNGKLINSLKWDDAFFWTDELAFSPDGKFLASGQYDAGYRQGIIGLWDMSTLQLVKSFGEYMATSGASTLAFSPDGGSVAFSTLDSQVTLWNITTNSGKQILATQPAWITSVAISPEGTSLAAGTQAGDIFLQDIASGKTINMIHLEGGAINSLIFSANGLNLYIADGIGLRSWDVASSTVTYSALDHTSMGSAISFSPDGMRLATFTYGAITIRDATNGVALQKLEGVGYATISTDWTLWVTSDFDIGNHPFLMLNDLPNGIPLRNLTQNVTDYKISSGLLFSPNGKTLAQGGGYNKDLLLWDITNPNIPRVFMEPEKFSEILAFSPDGKTLAIFVSNFGNIQFLDVAGGTRLKSLEAHNTKDLVFSPDGTILAIQLYDTVTLWDWKSGILLKTLDQGYSNQLAFSSDGKVLAVGGWVGDPSITLWEVSTGEKLASLTGHNLETTGLVFSPDGTRLVSSAQDGAVFFWGLKP